MKQIVYVAHYKCGHSMEFEALEPIPKKCPQCNHGKLLSKEKQEVEDYHIGYYL